MRIKNQDIKSEHVVNGKKVIVLKEQEHKYKPTKNKIKAKEYFSKLKKAK